MIEKPTGNLKIDTGISTNSVISKSLLATLVLIKVAHVIEINPSYAIQHGSIQRIIFIDATLPILMNLFNNIDIFLSEKRILTTI